jgi:hypothetical protein
MSAVAAGIPLQVGCTAACVLVAKATVPKSVARKLRIASAADLLTLARTTKRLAGAGTATLRLRPKASLRRALARRKKVKVTVHLTASGQDGRTRTSGAVVLTRAAR